MTAKRVTNRPLDRDFYNRYRGMLDRPWLPDDWQVFRRLLRSQLPSSAPLSDSEQQQLFEAATEVRQAASLLDHQDSIPAEALKHMLSGSFGQLGGFADRLPVLDSLDAPYTRLRHYLVEELQDLREAVYHSGKDAGCDYQLDNATSMVLYSAHGRQGTLPFYEALIAGFLWWILVSEWCWDRIDMG